MRTPLIKRKSACNKSIVQRAIGYNFTTRYYGTAQELLDTAFMRAKLEWHADKMAEAVKNIQDTTSLEDISDLDIRVADAT